MSMSVCDALAGAFAAGAFAGSCALALPSVNRTTTPAAKNCFIHFSCTNVDVAISAVTIVVSRYLVKKRGDWAHGAKLDPTGYDGAIVSGSPDLSRTSTARELASASSALWTCPPRHTRRSTKS